MRFVSSRFHASADPRLADGGAPALPPCLAFLVAFGCEEATLIAAARDAAVHAVDPVRALLARGEISEARFTFALSLALGVAFVENWPCLDPATDPPTAIRTGQMRLVDDPRARWLLAPSARQVDLLLAARAKDLALPAIALATPSHFAALLRHRAGSRIAHVASRLLPDVAPRLSAHAAVGPGTALTIIAALAAVVLGTFYALHLPTIVLGILFLAGLVFRFGIFAEGLAPRSETSPRVLPDAALPGYTILVPLYDEAAMVPGLVRALDQLDYPRAKREILFLVEAGDHATRAALVAERLPPGFVIFDVPAGGPRTKPRALNAGLSFARGELVTIFDAEDRPDRRQLRRAAARFAQVGDELACLQARLAIVDDDAGWLSRLFLVEYAALFDVFNLGLARLGLPIALGGTSNHFRAAALRRVGGWDAWNVTEDADLGLRLARFGYAIEMLDSTTWEEAPARLRDWIKQRRRWTKGWMQTLVVLARDCPAMLRDLGPRRALAVTLMLTNLVTGPLLTPWFLLLVALTCRGLPSPQGLSGIFEATLEVSVVALGAGGILWSGFVGARRRDLPAMSAALFFVPYQLMIAAAAWAGLADLFTNPYHWHKTPHGAAKPPSRSGRRAARRVRRPASVASPPA